MKREREEDEREVQKSYTDESEGNSSSMLVGIDPKLLHCFICNNLLLSSPIFQCKNGHVACSQCSSKVSNKCCKCSCKLDECPGLGAIIKSIKVSCPNSCLGCKETILYMNKNIHQESCPHSPCSCPIEDCTFKGPVQQLSAHFRSLHPVSKPLLYDSDLHVGLRLEEPFRVLQGEDGRLFLLLNSRESKSGYSLSVVLIGPGSVEQDLQYELTTWHKGDTLHLKACSITKMNEWKGVYPTHSFLFVPNNFCLLSGISNSIIVRVRIGKKSKS